MTYLELCKRVHQRSGMSGAGPTSVTAQSPTLTKLIGWVQDADIDIQSLHDDFKFLWARTASTLTMGKNIYIPGDFSLVRPKQLNLVRVDNHPAHIMDWDQWTLQIEPLTDGGYINSGTATIMTIDPAGSYLFYPTPDKDYPVVFDYYKKPIRLVSDTDVSPIPDEYQDVIVQKALMYYATFESDLDLYQLANAQFEEKYSLLCSSELPKIGFSPSPYHNRSNQGNF